MATDEQRFAIGLGVAAVAIAGLVLLFNLIDFEDGETDNPAPIMSPESVRAEPAGDVQLQRDAGAAGSGTADARAGANPEAEGVADGSDRSVADTPEADEVEPIVAATIDPVPLAYFEPDSSPLNLPPVLEKYLDRVERGTRFMARLETIVADNPDADSAGVSGDLALSFTAQSNTKRLSYNATHTTRWLEATFPEGESPDTADVLVDVRRDTGADTQGERVSLFFASVQETAGSSGFALDLDNVEGDLRVHVFALTDALPPLGSAPLNLDGVRE